MKKIIYLSFLIIAIASFDVKDLLDGTHKLNKKELNAFDQYINKDEEVYNWFYTNNSFNTLFGNKGYELNVTSLKWFNETQQTGPTGISIWSHQVVVIVPKNYTNGSVAGNYLGGGSNKNLVTNFVTDEEFLACDEVAWNTQKIVVITFQMPNQPLVFESDPDKKSRGEDAILAWAWKNAYETGNSTWMPRFPMVKAAFQCQKAAIEFLESKLISQEIINIDSFLVAGASKRGWTTWMLGAATCLKCPKVAGIIPIVPIVPNIHENIHFQYKSYNQGLTFAFSDYFNADIINLLDDQKFLDLLKYVEPLNYLERLERIPKVSVVSSDDEFMQFDWTQTWYDQMSGESHILINQNSEHSQATALFQLVSTMGEYLISLNNNETAKDRPSFSYKYNSTNGEISVQIPENVKHGKVVLYYAQTLQQEWRDFRWVKQTGENEYQQKCDAPNIKIKSLFGGNCFVPIPWFGKTLNETEGQPGHYSALPPKSADGFYMGYYIMIYFPVQNDLWYSDYQYTTPGYVWPSTFPGKDCKPFGSQCEVHQV